MAYTLKAINTCWPKAEQSVGTKPEWASRNDFTVSHRDKLYKIEEGAEALQGDGPCVDR